MDLLLIHRLTVLEIPKFEPDWMVNPKHEQKIRLVRNFAQIKLKIPKYKWNKMRERWEVQRDSMLQASSLEVVKCERNARERERKREGTVDSLREEENER